MTPLALKLFRDPLVRAQPMFRRHLAAAHCFEMTKVQPLMVHTSADLCATVNRTADCGPTMEHGGLLFAPAPVTWIEAHFVSEHGSGRMGALLHTVEEQIAFNAFQPGMNSLSGFWSCSQTTSIS